ncbi:MAG: YjhG/YagF family D-xylonate dehydratase [Anaerolineae bacterium]|nr:YjhG/YagF family D-xylonate dehydratase [Anaerolineae bacterium]
MRDREDILGSDEFVSGSRLSGNGPRGHLPLTEEILRNAPSGDLFGMTQNAAMGWAPEEIGREQYCIAGIQGGLRAPNGSPLALGYHTGHWEIPLLVERAAATIREKGGIPFSVYCSDPCDGRSQGTPGMFDSLPYRNDAAVILRRLIRSLPTRRGVMGIGTCDKGLPAIMMALAGTVDLPGIIVPGGATMPDPGAEDTGTVQTIGVRFTHGLIDLDYAAEMGCRACGSAGGGCQFLGTAATGQVVAEALGMALPHSALAPSGEPIWLDIAHRSALALLNMKVHSIALADVLTQHALENAMLIHAAFGGSTNLLLHIPAIAHAAGLRLPTVSDWQTVNRSVSRLVDVLPNGPRNHPTVPVFFAGAVPEVMLHLRKMGLLFLDVLTVTGQTLGENLDWWEQSTRRQSCRDRLAAVGHIDPDLVIMDADSARRSGLASTMIFPTGNIAPEGSLVKATTIDPSIIDAGNVFRMKGTARVFTSEQDAISGVKGKTDPPVKPGDVLVLIGSGPLGTGMEETYQITSALKHLPWGKHVPIITDGRFSGVSTGVCIGHIGPEALAGGAIGKLRNGDTIEIIIDRNTLEGSVNLVAADGRDLSSQEAASLLDRRPMHPNLRPHPNLPDDTRLWAALQRVSGGTWKGCLYDVDRIVEVVEAGLAAIE